MRESLYFFSISWIFRIGSRFLQIIWFNLLKFDKNLTVTLFFGGIKVGYPHHDIFTFLSTPSWQRPSNYFLEMDFCALGTGYILEWYGLLMVKFPYLKVWFSSYLVLHQRGTRIYSINYGPSPANILISVHFPVKPY